MCAYIPYSIKKLSWAIVNDSGQQFHPFAWDTLSVIHREKLPTWQLLGSSMLMRKAPVLIQWLLTEGIINTFQSLLVVS